MKRRLLAFAFFSLTVSTTIFAQNLETAMQFYKEGNYERALRIFEQSDSPSAYLFSGKSYFALNNFLKAKHFLGLIDSTDGDLFMEAKYTRALSDFQLKNFAASLDELYEIKKTSRHPDITRATNNFYRDVVNYLSPSQRFKAFRATSYKQVRLDLVEAAVGTVELGAAKALFSAYKNSVVNADTANLAPIQTLLNDSTAYQQRYNPNRYTKAPAGLAYNIGVVLPEFDFESQQFEIPQHLYFGIQLAVENFNSENSDKKAFITYQNDEVNSASAIANNLIWNHSVDAIIGPLFSESAAKLSKYAEEYQVPMLTPLANSDSLNLDLNYTFQLNPTFAIQGRKIAQYAIQKLGYDTLAVIAEKGSLGEPSAVAFQKEARSLGAHVVRYFVEDLESQGYDISEYVKYFDPKVDTVFNYHIDAVYAPFTGNIAETLISSLLTNLEAMQSTMTILGSEEWETTDLSTRRLPQTAIYYTKTFERQSGNTDIEDFESAFRLRFNMEPNRFAFIGYDAANVLLKTLSKVQNPAYLKEGLKKFNNYRGLITNVSFRNTHINQEVKIKQIRP
jgi:ABC-type branched-subunit amino acid transport system substrate-binding protein